MEVFHEESFTNVFKHADTDYLVILALVVNVTVV
jgi:hypothetical protein